MLLVITGKARHGKDTLGNILAEELFSRTGRRFILMAYGNELKNRVQKDFDLSYEQLWGDEKEIEDKRYPKKDGGFWTPREIMQFMGTECFRAVDNNFWVNSLFNTIDDNEFKDVIITDARFPNEALPVQERGGYVIRITRNIDNNIHGQQHVSETAMDNFQSDIDIVNSGTIEDLRASTKTVVNFLLNNEKLKI